MNKFNFDINSLARYTLQSCCKFWFLPMHFLLLRNPLCASLTCTWPNLSQYPFIDNFISLNHKLSNSGRSSSFYNSYLIGQRTYLKIHHTLRHMSTTVKKQAIIKWSASQMGGSWATISWVPHRLPPWYCVHFRPRLTTCTVTICRAF